MKPVFRAGCLLATACLLVVLSTGCHSGLKRAWHLRRANQYYSASQWDRAEIEYLNVVRTDPANYQAISRLGEIYFAQGRVQVAGQFLVRARQLNTNDLAVRVRLGQIYQASGRFKEARTEARFVLDHQPQNADAPVLLAESADTAQEQAAARLYLNHLPPTASQPNLLVALGILSFRQADFPGAETAFKRAQTLDPKGALAWAGLGVLCQQKKDFPAAETALKTAAELAPRRSNLRVNYANYEIQTGHPEVADAFLAETLRQTPDFVPAWVLRAEIALAAQKYDECATFLEGARTRDPDNYDAALLSGQLDMSRGESARARTQFERLAHRYPGIPRLHYLLALTCLSNNDPNAAVVSLNRALTLETNFTDASLLLAQVQIKTGALDSAVAILRRLVEREPNLTQASLLLADTYRARRQPGEALAIYDQMGRSGPPNSGLFLLKGITYREAADNASARRAFSRALELAPGNVRVLDALVSLDLTEKQYEPAIQMLEATLPTSTNKYDLFLLEANVFQAQGNAAQTVAALQKAIHLSPDSPAAHLILAQHYYKTLELPKALDEVQAVLQVTPGNQAAWLFKSQVLNATKDYAGAAAACERILAIDPQSSVALNNLACLDSEYLGRLDQAYELAQKARKLQPFDPSTADTLGWVLFHKKDYASALELLQESAGKLPRNAAVQFHYGKASYMQGKEAAATTALQLALQLNPSFEGHEDCQRCLDLLAIHPEHASPAVLATLEKRIAEVPDDPVALTRLAVCYQQSGDNGKAVRTEEAILSANPNNAKAMLDLARLYSLNNDPQALELANKAYKASPQNPDAAHLLGWLVFQQRNFKWALSLLEQAAQGRPNNPNVQYDLARAAYSLGKVAVARSAYQSALDQGLAAPQAAAAKQSLELIADAGQATLAPAAGPRAEAILKTDPNNVPALMVAALGFEQNTNLEAAGLNYEKVLKLLPDFAPAQKKLALIYARNPQRLRDAHALALSARQSLPEDAELARLLGLILYQQGDYQSAVNYLSLGAANRPNDPELFYYLGLSQFHLHESAASKMSLRHALELNLSGPMAVEAQRILRQLK